MQSVLDSISSLPVPDGLIYVGYSGGIDSQVLLHSLAMHPVLKHKLVAVHVHHGLQTIADQWVIFCEQQCFNLAIPFRLVKVDARPRVGQSLEEAARLARYAVFDQLLTAQDYLLFAHHQEDQLETFLLQLVRGAGVKGLSAMPGCSVLGAGRLIRPFLDLPKAHILNYAQQHELSWVEDPTNQEDRFDRNWLRQRILPLLTHRWPSVAKTVARSAQHCADASCFIDEWVAMQLPTILDHDGGLLIEPWQLFSREQGVQLLRYWLMTYLARPPSNTMIAVIINQVINARHDAQSVVEAESFKIRKFRHKLFCLSAKQWQPFVSHLNWSNKQVKLDLQNGYFLSFELANQGIDRCLWETQEITVKPRIGGEKLRLPKRQGQHCLKKLYQEAGVSPWLREQIPLIYLNDKLAAVPGLWVDQWALAKPETDAYQIVLNLNSGMEVGETQ